MGEKNTRALEFIQDVIVAGGQVAEALDNADDTVDGTTTTTTTTTTSAGLGISTMLGLPEYVGNSSVPTDAVLLGGAALAWYKWG